MYPPKKSVAKSNFLFDYPDTNIQHIYIQKPTFRPIIPKKNPRCVLCRLIFKTIRINT